MTTYAIPLSPEAQRFSIDLAGVSYTAELTWCVPSAAWILSLADSAGVPILTSIPLVPNVDLLQQYPELNFGGKLIAQTDNNADAVPTYSNLGISSQLYFVTP